MYYEASGAFEEAETLLREQLAEAPESQLLLKRAVALEKSRGNAGAAIEALRRYVDVYQTDREAWEELGELYLQVWRVHLGIMNLCGSVRVVCMRLQGPAWEVLPEVFIT